MPELLTSEAALDALRLSLITAAISTALCIVLGGPLAVVLARGRLPGLRVLRSVVLLPLVLPPVVGGLALLFLLGRTGLLGRQLDLWFGITIPFTTTAVVLAQTFVALPFLVVSLEGALRTAGGRYEAVAATLGAGPGYAFRHVTVPLVLPGLASGSMLAFARCLGEFGATTAFAGSLQGTTRTLPLLVYLERETDVDGRGGAVAPAGRGRGGGHRGRARAADRGVVVTGDDRHAAPSVDDAEPPSGGRSGEQACVDLDQPEDGAGHAPGLDAAAVVRRPGFTLDVAITVDPGDVLAVLGPNGSGKSTLLDVLAGLLRPDAGHVRVGGRTLTDSGVHVPPHRRGVGLLAQQPLLFPHLTALANVAFGPRAQGMSRRAATARARELLDAVDVAGLADRRPAQLSGGQQQRVALARALAAGPDLLLLDEPLAALDVDTMPAMRALLRRTIRDSGRTAVLVTHAALDALVLADRVIVLSDGGRGRGGADARGARPPAQPVRRADRRARPRARRRLPRGPEDGRRVRDHRARRGDRHRRARGRGVPARGGGGVRAAPAREPAQRRADPAGRGGAARRPRAPAGRGGRRGAGVGGGTRRGRHARGTRRPACRTGRAAVVRGQGGGGGDPPGRPGAVTAGISPAEVIDPDLDRAYLNQTTWDFAEDDALIATPALEPSRDQVRVGFGRHVVQPDAHDEGRRTERDVWRAGRRAATPAFEVDIRARDAGVPNTPFQQRSCDVSAIRIRGDGAEPDVVDAGVRPPLRGQPHRPVRTPDVGRRDEQRAGRAAADRDGCRRRDSA